MVHILQSPPFAVFTWHIGQTMRNPVVCISHMAPNFQNHIPKICGPILTKSYSSVFALQVCKTVLILVLLFLICMWLILCWVLLLGILRLPCLHCMCIHIAESFVCNFILHVSCTLQNPYFVAFTLHDRMIYHSYG